MPRYLYGLVPAGAAAPSERGVGGGTVHVAPGSDELAVLTSTIDQETIQPRRAHLGAHDQVLRSAMAAGPVLPFRFGMITTADPADVLEGIDAGRARDRLALLAGRVEVQVLWEPDQDVTIGRIVERHPEVRDRNLSSIDRGRSVAEAVAALAVEDLEAIRRSLTDHAVLFGDVESHGMSARAAALVEDALLDGFLATCRAVAERAAGAGTLRTVGALPPYSFVALDREPIGA